MKRLFLACALLCAGMTSRALAEPALHVADATISNALIAPVLAITVTPTHETCTADELPTCVDLFQVSSEGAGPWVDTFNFRNISAQAWSTSGSSATVTIECRSHPSAVPYPCATMVDPNSTDGKYVSLPRSYQYRANIRPTQYSSGVITVTIERYHD